MKNRKVKKDFIAQNIVANSIFKDQPEK